MKLPSSVKSFLTIIELTTFVLGVGSMGIATGIGILYLQSLIGGGWISIGVTAFMVFAILYLSYKMYQSHANID